MVLIYYKHIKFGFSICQYVKLQTEFCYKPIPYKRSLLELDILSTNVSLYIKIHDLSDCPEIIMFYTLSLEGPPGTSSNWIDHLSVRNSIPLTNIKCHSSCLSYSNQTWTLKFMLGLLTLPFHHMPLGCGSLKCSAKAM